MKRIATTNPESLSSTTNTRSEMPRRRQRGVGGFSVITSLLNLSILFTINLKNVEGLASRSSKLFYSTRAEDIDSLGKNFRPASSRTINTSDDLLNPPQTQMQDPKEKVVRESLEHLIARSPEFQSEENQRLEIRDAAFEGHFDDLLRFKKEHGHCDVPQRFSDNPALGRWCSNLRYTYNQPGKVRSQLSLARIVRLEEVGFKWNVIDEIRDAAFDKHLEELKDFKERFGHCGVSSRYAENPSLGKWCSNVRTSYKKRKQGQKQQMDLSDERIERLNCIGFQWESGSARNAAFDKRIDELADFKKEFGHCNVPSRFSDNPSLGYWCRDLRYGYKKLQKGEKPRLNLSEERIERLEEVGFQWQLS